MRDPSVDVVIVNWNGGDGVLRAAHSAAAFGARVTVVDNGSTDGSADLVEGDLVDVRLIRLRTNTGFAHACNVGVGAGDGEYVFLLNPDAEIVRGATSDLDRAFAFDPRVTIVGTLVLDAEDRPTRSVRQLPDPFGMILYQLKLHPLARWIPPLRRYLMVDFPGDRPAIVGQVMGAAFVMRRRDWERFSGLDEGYFLWFEEVDLSKRVADAGGVTVYWPAIAVRHTGGASFAKLSARRRQVIWNRSLARYARSHFSRQHARAVIAVGPVAQALNAIADVVRRIRPRAPRAGHG